MAWSCGEVSEVCPSSVHALYEEIAFDSEEGEWIETALRAAGRVTHDDDDETWMTTSEEQTTTGDDDDDGQSDLVA